MKSEFIEKFKQAYQEIEKAETILLVSHVHPDADALSSLGIMIDLLESLGKDYLAYAKDKEGGYDYLPHEDKIASSLPTGFDLLNFDLIIALDCGSMARTGLGPQMNNILPLPLIKRPVIIEFDHHPKTDDYADLEIRLPELTSNTEVLYHFLKINNLSLNKNLANCLLAGILADTGNFLYPATSDAAIKISAEMLNYGAQLPKIVQSTYQNKDLLSMKIWGLALKNLKINQKYNLAVSVLTQIEIQTIAQELEVEISNDIFGDIVGFLSNLGGVKGVLLIREEADNRFKGNLRSAHPGIDMAKLAGVFGGGGHPKASGFLLGGSINRVNDGWTVNLR